MIVWLIGVKHKESCDKTLFKLFTERLHQQFDDAAVSGSFGLCDIGKAIW